MFVAQVVIFTFYEEHWGAVESYQTRNELNGTRPQGNNPHRRTRGALKGTEARAVRPRGCRVWSTSGRQRKGKVGRQARGVVEVELTAFMHGGGGGLVAKSCPTLNDPMTVAHQAPLSVGLSRQESCSGLPFPSPGDLPSTGIELRSAALQADSLLTQL